ncbi:MAG: caspase family protein [Myxococcaceae bacterium]
MFLVLSAAPASPHTYAVVVGSNAGGPGQGTLRFAEDDARRMADVLVQLGHYRADDVKLLLHPKSDEVLSAIADLSATTRANSSRGEQSMVVFYYSGHARSTALTLGGQEVALADLREKLSTLPSTVTIVVLDACQSGAFARVKGSEPAADFTYNSVQRLKQKGLAVMASSTSQELSQESDELSASYFTHHLVTALRGAGDADEDGRVSLDEAYRYAYRHTLASTARTAVGEQHVTLENNLAGQDELPVTWPSEAKAKLELPAKLDARVLVQKRPSGAVMAEVEKAPGAAIRLSLIAGSYDAVVGRPSGAVQCHFELQDDVITVLPADDPTKCQPVLLDATAPKGGPDASLSAPLLEAPPRTEGSKWELQLDTGFVGGQHDTWVNTLGEFGYRGGSLGLRVDAAVSRELVPHLAVQLELGTLSNQTFHRDLGTGTSDSASLNAYRAVLLARLYSRLVFDWLGIYAQAGAGAGLATLGLDQFQNGARVANNESWLGPVVEAAGGVTLSVSRWSFFVQATFDYAPIAKNLFAQTHDSGGLAVVTGARFRFGEAP